MEYVYTAHTKIIDHKTYYFVKKIMALPEFKGLADIVTGYGMHTSFEKACDIAGINSISSRQKLLLGLVEPGKPQLPEKQHAVKFPEVIDRWLAARGAEVLN